MSDRVTEQTGEPYPEGGGYPATEAAPGAAEASTGQLIAEVAGDLSTLMRQELELAKAELKQEAGKAGKGAGLLGAAGVGGQLLLVFLSLALMFALDVVMPIGWAALIVAVWWGAVALVAFRMGRASLASVSPKPEQTVETLKEDVQWARHPTR